MRRMRHALKGSFGCHVIRCVTCHNQMSRTTEGCWLIASYAPTRRSFTSVFYENPSQSSLLSALNPAYFYRNTKCAGRQQWRDKGRVRGNINVRCGMRLLVPIAKLLLDAKKVCYTCDTHTHTHTHHRANSLHKQCRANALSVNSLWLNWAKGLSQQHLIWPALAPDSCCVRMCVCVCLCREMKNEIKAFKASATASADIECWQWQREPLRDALCCCCHWISAWSLLFMCCMRMCVCLCMGVCVCACEGMWNETNEMKPQLAARENVRTMKPFQLFLLAFLGFLQLGLFIPDSRNCYGWVWSCMCVCVCAAGNLTEIQVWFRRLCDWSVWRTEIDKRVQHCSLATCGYIMQFMIEWSIYII